MNPALTDSQDQTREPVEVIDLQQVGLSGITVTGDMIVVGATTTLQELSACTLVTEGLRELARREQPSTLRTLATMGGTVAAANPESELLACLLALRATISLLRISGTDDASMATTLSSPETLIGSIITSVSFKAGGLTVSDRTARTPMDRPIVSVVGHRADDGTVTLAATGIATAPTVLEAGQTLSPPGDFRGSARYRTALLRTHAARVAGRLGN